MSFRYYLINAVSLIFFALSVISFWVYIQSGENVELGMISMLATILLALITFVLLCFGIKQGEIDENPEAWELQQQRIKENREKKRRDEALKKPQA